VEDESESAGADELSELVESYGLVDSEEESELVSSGVVESSELVSSGAVESAMLVPVLDASGLVEGLVPLPVALASSAERALGKSPVALVLARSEDTAASSSTVELVWLLMQVPALY
jgi:hypothetical protein